MENKINITGLLTGTKPNQNNQTQFGIRSNSQTSFDQLFQGEMVQPKVKESKTSFQSKNKEVSPSPQIENSKPGHSLETKPKGQTERSENPIESRNSQNIEKEVSNDPSEKVNSNTGEKNSNSDPKTRGSEDSLKAENTISQKDPNSETASQKDLNPIKEKPQAIETISSFSQQIKINEQTLIEQLKALKVDSETIESILQNFKGDPNKVQEIIKALPDLLQAVGASGITAELEKLTNSNGNLSSNLNQEQFALDILKQAGLTEAQAKTIINKIQKGLSNAENTKSENLISKTFDSFLNGEKILKNNIRNSSQNTATVVSEKTSQVQSKISFETLNLTSQNNEAPSQISSLLMPSKGTDSGLPAPLTLLMGKVPLNPSLTLGSTAGTNVTNLNNSVDGTLGSLVNGTSDASTKSVEALKPAFQETYSARATVEKSVTAQIVEKFSLRGMNGNREFNIRLDPPSLGTVRMNVTSSGETVKTLIVAENHSVKQIIETNLNQLKDSISSQGLKIDSFTVLVGGDQNQNTANQREQFVKPYNGFGQNSNEIENNLEDSKIVTRNLYFNENQSISLFA